MPDQDSSATAGDNAGNSNSDTSTDTKNEGAANSSDTSTDTKKDEGLDKVFTQEDVNRLIAKERKETERKAKMSEDERLKSDLEDARKQLRERDTKDAVQTEASKLGAKNTGLIYKAVKDDLTFDKDGKPENLKDVLTQAKKDFPELFGSNSNGSADGGMGKTPTPNNSLDNQIRQALGYA